MYVCVCVSSVAILFLFATSNLKSICSFKLIHFVSLSVCLCMCVLVFVCVCLCGFDSYSTTFGLSVFWHARADVVATFAFCGVPGRFQKSMKYWVCAIVLSRDDHKDKPREKSLSGGRGRTIRGGSVFFVLVLSKKQQHRQFIQSFFFCLLACYTLVTFNYKPLLLKE